MAIESLAGILRLIGRLIFCGVDMTEKSVTLKTGSAE
jgi:hypothetical protein